MDISKEPITCKVAVHFHHFASVHIQFCKQVWLSLRPMYGAKPSVMAGERAANSAALNRPRPAFTTSTQHR